MSSSCPRSTATATADSTPTSRRRSAKDLRSVLRTGRTVAGALAAAFLVHGATTTLTGQAVAVVDVTPMHGTLLAAERGVENPMSSGERPGRPAWVVGDVPDTVWILVEASVAEGGDEGKALLREAEGHARAAIQGNETNVGRRFALAAVLGMRTDVEGGRTKVGVASDLYDELGVVLELDPEHTRARYMMGRLHAGVRRMGGVTRWLATNLLGGNVLKQASWEEAERHLSFAEEHAPEVPDHHLQLARLYLDTGRRELAARETRHVLGMSARSPLERAARLEAEELAAELGLGG